MVTCWFNSPISLQPHKESHFRCYHKKSSAKTTTGWQNTWQTFFPTLNVVRNCSKLWLKNETRFVNIWLDFIVGRLIHNHKRHLLFLFFFLFFLLLIRWGRRNWYGLREKMITDIDMIQWSELCLWSRIFVDWKPIRLFSCSLYPPRGYIRIHWLH